MPFYGLAEPFYSYGLKWLIEAWWRCFMSIVSSRGVPGPSGQF